MKKTKKENQKEKTAKHIFSDVENTKDPKEKIYELREYINEVSAVLDRLIKQDGIYILSADVKGLCHYTNIRPYSRYDLECEKEQRKKDIQKSNTKVKDIMVSIDFLKDSLENLKNICKEHLISYRWEI